MIRTIISDLAWERIGNMLSLLRVYQTDGLRESVEGMFWRVRTGAPWRDLPEAFGNWKTVYNRFNEWSRRGIWNELFEACKGDVDDEWNFMDGSYIKAHQHAAGGGEAATEQTIGQSRGGNTTKVHMLVDAHGNPIAFEVTAGNIHDVSRAEALIVQSEAENIIADKAYDSEGVRQASRDKSMVPHIPRKSNSSKPNPEFDPHLYRYRHLVENVFARLKHFRGFATRYDKLTRNYRAVVAIACSWIWIRLEV